MNTNEFLHELAAALTKSIDDFYPIRMGFALIIFPFGNSPFSTDYISNGQRKDMVKALRESANRIENGDVIGPVIGSA